MISMPRFTLARAIALGLGSLVFAAQLAHASPFTPGNIVVVRVGDGSAPLSSASTAVFLDEYTPGGTLVQTIPLPTAASGSNSPFTNSGTATSECYLNLSIDGQYLVQGGYGVAPGTASIASTSSSTAPRVIARIGMNGTIDTSTLLNGDTSYSGSNIRSATSNDGHEFWTAGTASSSADGGVRYVASLGANTSTQLSSTVTNTRVIGAFAGQLYVSTASGSFKGVNTVGSGLPTSAGQTITLLPGFPAPTPSEYDFFFADASTLYVADDGSSGGIEKWTLSGGTWTRQYVLSPGPSTGCRGLTGSVAGGVATLYATTTQTSANQIVVVADTGASSTFNPVATAGTNVAFRGIRLVGATGVGPGIDLCVPGVGGVMPCPCGNPQVPANSVKGCDNSAATGGAILSSGGTASLGSDSLTFTSASEKPTASSILLQGHLPASGTGVKFGQGVRCITLVLKRLYVHNAFAGTVVFPITGDLSISAESAVKGDVIAPGTSRLYAVYYRDPVVLGACTPLVDTFNISQTQSVLWSP
jgi:hypothetical protein